MTGRRSVPEWIGATPDTPVPPRVRLRVFEAHNGLCHLTGLKITGADAWDMDHVKALANGGENRESNLAPALRKAHRVKTAEDVAKKATSYRKRSKFLGIKPEKPAYRKVPGSRGTGFRRKLNGMVERVDE